MIFFVIFNWLLVVGVIFYMVIDVIGLVGILVGELYMVIGLIFGQVVIIIVMVNMNNVCGLMILVEVSCVVNVCLNFNINIILVLDICFIGFNVLIILMVIVSGGVGGGIFSWSGFNVVGD